MKKHALFMRAGEWLLLAFLFTAPCYAQFNGTISGTVQDPSGSVVAGAAIQLKNLATQDVQNTVSGPDGNYNFVSLGPADYEIDVQAKTFAHYRVQITLQTGQTLSVPVKLVLASATQRIEVTGQAPVLDTADTRLQETFSTKALSSLPLAGRNMISLVTLAPGVTGLGVTSNGSPGSGRDNFSTETQVDASANGQGAVGNMYVIDGLDVTSSIRPGVLNMTPNPDTIQEASIQSNTYNVDYGRASSIQMMMTTKSGGSKYHGNISDYFTNQTFLAGTEFTHKYAPFHTNNISATIGGPIIPHHSGFFFFGIEPLRSSSAVAYPVIFEDPAFTQFAQQSFPNTIGTKILSSYPVSKVSNVRVSSVASDVYPNCGTAAVANIPCGLPLLDIGNYSDTGYRNGNQYFLRLDKAFRSDRLYGSWYRTTLNSNGPNPRAAFNTTNSFYQYALQVNETHIFSPNTLNEAAFAAMRVEGITPKTGLFTVPVVNVTGLGAGFGDGFAEGDFIQHNYHWRDVLTHVAGSHTLKAGIEGLFGDDVEKFAGPYDLPNFSFNSMLDLVQDKVYTESSLAYDPLTGQKVQWDWNAAGTTFGAFVEDTWKVHQNLTMNYGLRWDDFGNPYSRSANTAFSNFFPGPGQTYQEQIANGIVVRHHHALNRSITDVFSPRFGLAWDVTGNGNWLVKGGFGFFHNWPTLANLQEEFRGNPPGPIFPTFYGGTAPEPIFGLGTNNTQPFGYTVPTLPARQLDAHGGLAGLQFGIGGINPNLVSPVSYVYSSSLERSLGSKMMASISYAGSVGRKLLSGGGQVYNVSYGQDINTLPGDLIIHNSTVPTRLNTSFGSISYTTNDRESAYNALILAWQGRFSQAFFNVSYTRSVSKDDTQVYPSYINVHQWYGPSIWDVPNRLSLAWNYLIPNPIKNNNFFNHVTGGWQLSGTTILQSGTPFVVYTNASFSNGGDYNADGDNYDFPNVTNYQYGTSRKRYLNGIFSAANFAAPTPGTEGNEKYNAFRGPGYAQSDLALLKNTQLKGPASFQLRFEFYNIFNRANLNSVDANLPDGTFGRATGQYTPRLLQIGGNLSF